AALSRKFVEMFARLLLNPPAPPAPEPTCIGCGQTRERCACDQCDSERKRHVTATARHRTAPSSTRESGGHFLRSQDDPHGTQEARRSTHRTTLEGIPSVSRDDSARACRRRPRNAGANQPL